MSFKIGFIGVGGIAQYHIKGLQRIDAVQIVRIYDVNKENTAKVAASTGAQVMNSADEVMDRNRVDAVFICTPQFAREEFDVTAARRGIHFFVEKPLGLKIEEVEKKEKVISASGVIHSVGYCLRYLDTVQEAKAYLMERQAHLIQAYRFGASHPSAWWYQQDMSGGHLVDTVTHQVDMIRFIAGEFGEIHAKFGRVSYDRIHPERTIYDAGVISFQMESGTIGSITESCLSNHHGTSEIKLFGPDFFVHLNGNGKTLTIIDSTQNITKTSTMDSYFEQSKAFVEAVTTGDQSRILSNYRDGMKTLSMTLAANR